MYDLLSSKEHDVSEQTIYTWLKRFRAMNTNELKRLRQLETESPRESWRLFGVSQAVMV